MPLPPATPAVRARAARAQPKAAATGSAVAARAAWTGARRADDEPDAHRPAPAQDAPRAREAHHRTAGVAHVGCARGDRDAAPPPVSGPALAPRWRPVRCSVSTRPHTRACPNCPSGPPAGAAPSSTNPPKHARRVKAHAPRARWYWSGASPPAAPARRHHCGRRSPRPSDRRRRWLRRRGPPCPRRACRSGIAAAARVDDAGSARGQAHGGRRRAAA